MQLSGARRDNRQVQSAIFESSPCPCTAPFLGRCLGVALVILTLLVLLPGHSVAVDFYGSDPLGSTGLTVAPGVDLLNSDQFHLATVFGNPGTGDFGTVPYFMILTPEDWLIDISDLSGLTLGTEEFGTFTSTTGSIVSRSPEFVNVELNGLFERASFDDTAATLHFAMTKTGQSVSWSGTLAVGMDSGTGECRSRTEFGHRGNDGPTQPVCADPKTTQRLCRVAAIVVRKWQGFLFAKLRLYRSSFFQTRGSLPCVCH